MNVAQNRMETSAMTEIIRVTSRQVGSARALVKLSGGLDHVDPLIRKIATAAPAFPRSNKVVRVTRRQVASAQALVRLSGGLDHVDPLVRKIATAELAPENTQRGDGTRTA